MEGKIVLVVFPQDAMGKLRPAFVLREFPKYGDVLVCGISTQINQYIPGLDLLINPNHPDFALSGLKAASICRLSMLAMVATQNIRGTVGALRPATHAALLKSLSDYLIKSKT
jgi:mRNA interferase MazF